MTPEHIKRTTYLRHHAGEVELSVHQHPEIIRHKTTTEIILKIQNRITQFLKQPTDIATAYAAWLINKQSVAVRFEDIEGFNYLILSAIVVGISMTDIEYSLRDFLGRRFYIDLINGSVCVINTTIRIVLPPHQMDSFLTKLNRAFNEIINFSLHYTANEYQEIHNKPTT